jgi:hypothetical protein
MLARTRLARVTYRGQPAGAIARSSELTRSFTEHFDIGWPLGTAPSSGQPKTSIRGKRDPNELATLELFEFMIGNTDWSAVAAPQRRSLLSYARQGAGQPRVAYDFDFLGRSSTAPYATRPPPPQFLDSVRVIATALYRGFCHPEVDWTQLFAALPADRARAIPNASCKTEIGALEGIATARPRSRNLAAVLRNQFSFAGKSGQERQSWTRARPFKQIVLENARPCCGAQVRRSNRWARGAHGGARG